MENLACSTKQFTKEHSKIISHLCHLALGMRGISLQNMSPWLGKDSAANTPSWLPDPGMFSTSPMTAVFKDSLKGMWPHPRRWTECLPWGQSGSWTFLLHLMGLLLEEPDLPAASSAELSRNYHRHRRSALRKIFEGHAMTSPVSCSTIWKCHFPTRSRSPYYPYPSSFPNLW